VVVGVSGAQASGPTLLSLGESGRATGAVSVDPGVTAGFRWASSNPAVATVASDGTLTPLAFGTTQITLLPLADTTAGQTFALRVTGDCGTAPIPLTVNTNVSGSITEASCAGPAAGSVRRNRYEFTLTQPSIVRAEITAGTLRNQTVGVLELGGTWLDTRSSQARYLALLPAGTHRAVAGTTDADFRSFGTYAFRVQQNVSPSACDHGVFARNISFVLGFSAACPFYRPPGVSGAEVRTQTLRSELADSGATFRTTIAENTVPVVVDYRVWRPADGQQLSVPNGIATATTQIGRSVRQPGDAPTTLTYTTTRRGEVLFITISSYGGAQGTYRFTVDP
jgi:hypothetical protein